MFVKAQSLTNKIIRKGYGERHVKSSVIKEIVEKETYYGDLNIYFYKEKPCTYLLDNHENIMIYLDKDGNVRSKMF